MIHMRTLILFISLLVATSITGCRQKETEFKKPSVKLPFTRIATDDEDPADNGPGDETELDAMPGKKGMVLFSHFKHASNSKTGYGIPCLDCHHSAETSDDASGCSDCHDPPEPEEDPAHNGPDNNLLLCRNHKYQKTVLFNHFTHASNDGYKITCENCHHKYNVGTKCSTCHQQIATQKSGNIVPKRKRAFHHQCQGCHKKLIESNPEAKAPVKCEQCHTGKDFKPTKEMISLERAYHQQCIDCHQQFNHAKNVNKAPEECLGCHKNNSPEE